MKNGDGVKISLPGRRRMDNGQLKSGKRSAAHSSFRWREGGRMVPPEVVPPSLETRLNLVSRRVYQLLADLGEADLERLGAVLQIPNELTHVAVGWLARSRVVDLIEGSAGKLQVRIRRPFE
jgi:hypothetical protein